MLGCRRTGRRLLYPFVVEQLPTGTSSITLLPVAADPTAVVYVQGQVVAAGKSAVVQLSTIGSTTANH